VCYVTTGVVSGSAFCVVVDTGLRTFIGRTARLVSGAKSGGPDDRNLNDYVASIGWMFWTAIVATVIMLCSIGASRTDILRIALSCTMLTFYANGRGTAISMRAKMAAEMSEQGAILQSIQDLETLAAIDVLLTDTTGTITENRVSLGDSMH
jgi:H+-transporting ATPase